jgi:cell division transport system permease protein
MFRALPPDHISRAEAPQAAQVSVMMRWSQPLVPSATIAGRSLVIVITILTFLAALTACGVYLMAQASNEWRSSIAREATIQVRPQAQTPVETSVKQAELLAKAHPGVREVIVFSKEDSERLLEPWLGKGIGLGLESLDLPIPRLIVVRFNTATAPDLSALRAQLSKEVQGATLDDHRVWIQRLSTMANTVIVVGLIIVGLVLSASALAVAFATRGALTGAKHIIEVLHFVGAEDSFIAREFQARFLILGLKGGLTGAALAALSVGGASFFSRVFQSPASRDQIEALFGSFAIGWAGFGSIFAVAALSALVTVSVSRLTVRAHLRNIT